jgi:hypothetical protein
MYYQLRLLSLNRQELFTVTHNLKSLSATGIYLIPPIIFHSLTGTKMSNPSLAKAGILTIILVASSVLCWELYLRSIGYKLAYNDDESLWRKNRANVYGPLDKTTVFIGSSRIEFDLDQPTWEKTTGEKPIQLALHGSCPRLALDNLASDEKFKGKLVIDVTEGLFFRPDEDGGMSKRVKYYKNATPANLASDKLDFALESQFLFLDKEMFSMNAFLNDLRIKSRKGVFMDPIFPRKFSYVNYDRQEIMTDDFVKDTAIQRRVTDIWTIFGALGDGPGIGGDTLQKIFTEVQTAVAKIKARGGQVIFIRTPSSGGYWAHEPIAFPREKYFDKLLSVTGCKGIHFKDDPETAGLICPEWSHLKPSDAIVYTNALIKALEKENWFTHSN